MTWWTRCLSSLATLLLLFAPVAARSAPAIPPELKQKVKEAQNQYDLGHFDDSLRLFSEAYETKPLPGILFNIAQCHRHLGNWERASFFYKRYLSLSPPKVKNGSETREFIKEMDAKQDEAKRKQEEDELAARQQRELELARLHGGPLPEGATPPTAETQTQTPPVPPPPHGSTVASNDVPRDTGFVPNPPPPLLSSTSSSSLDSNPAGEAQAKVGGDSLFTKWWFWTGVGVLVVGAGTTAYVVSQQNKAPACTASLGCH